MENLSIIKNLSKKIHIDPFFYFFMIISCLSASFKNFSYFLSIIIIHELGHLTMGMILGWKVDKICLYPYGGVIKFNEDINRKLIEEIMILIMGPITQLIYLFFGNFIFRSAIFVQYNLAILFFNLLPIYPLDGGKILNLLLNYFFSFRMSYYLSIVTSFIFSFLLIFISLREKYTFNLIFMFLIVISKIFEELRKRKYYFNKFILERYLNNYHFQHLKTISSIKKMMRDKRHIIKNHNTYYTEKEYLRKLYGRK